MAIPIRQNNYICMKRSLLPWTFHPPQQCPIGMPKSCFLSKLHSLPEAQKTKQRMMQVLRQSVLRNGVSCGRCIGTTSIKPSFRMFSIKAPTVADVLKVRYCPYCNPLTHLFVLWQQNADETQVSPMRHTGKIANISTFFQIKLMEERCILLDNDDNDIGTESKLGC